MDVLINELSLDGQFKSEEDFLDNLSNLLPIIKIIDMLNFSLAKNYTFYSSKVTINKTFSDVVKLQNIAMAKDKRTQLKSYLLKLSNKPPYWNDTQVHNCDADSYTFNTNNICETSLAEGYERDKIVLSFRHSSFLNGLLNVQKNNLYLNIYNVIERKTFLDYLYKFNEIDIVTYCNEKFKTTNLNFDLLEAELGFDILDDNQKNEFINSFNMFSSMSWMDINNSDGLEYKKYNKPKKKKVKGWFRKGIYKDTDIYKFRTTQGYRCFGYRESDIFYILRFEIDHSISDNG